MDRAGEARLPQVAHRAAAEPVGIARGADHRDRGGAQQAFQIGRAQVQVHRAQPATLRKSAFRFSWNAATPSRASGAIAAIVW